MYLPWLLLALALPLMAQHPKPDPGASPEEYRQAVAASIQSLVSGRRPRDPTMSGASTGRLILEGVVENLRIYRTHKEERAREAREKEEEERRRRERRSREYDGRDSSSDRKHRHRSHRDEGDGGRHRRRVGHGSAGDAKGRRRRRHRHRSADEEEHGRRRRHRSQSREGHGDRRLEVGRDQKDHDHQHPSRSIPRGGQSRTGGEHLISGALHAAEQVAEQLLGPDGTPFGFLPTRGKGVGLLAHAKTTYGHIKAEQGAGHRSKGFAEKHIDAFLQNRKGTKHGGKGMIEKDRRSCNGRSRHNGDRRRRRKSRSRGGERRSREGAHSVFVPVGEGRELSGTRQGSPVPSHSGRSLQEPTLCVQQPPISVQQSRRDSLHDSDRGEPNGGHEGVKASRSSRGDERVPSVRVQSPGSVRSPRLPTPSVQGPPSVREDYKENTAGSPCASRAPTICVQSQTPPKQAESIRSPTSFVHGTQSRGLSPESERQEPTTPVRDPAPFHHAAPTPSMPILPPAVATPYSVAHSGADMPLPVVPPMPLPPPPVVRPLVNPAQDAFLASIQAGMKLRKVSEAERKDASAARKDDSRIKDVLRQAPMYEETPHSHNVEAMEHAQAIEQMERRQEVERDARTKTIFIAPQPVMKMPANFRDELAAKLGQMSLNRQGGDGVSEAGPSETPNVVKPRASNETWTTVFADHDEENRVLDRQFRQDLGDRMSAGGTPRPPTAAAMPSQAPLRMVTPASDVFLNLSANIAGPGWQPGPAWDFSNVPKEGSN